MKKIAIPILMAFIIATFLSTPALASASAMPDTIAQPAPTPKPIDWDTYAPNGELDASKIAADSAILIDAKTGKVLFNKDENEHRYPASTTKIMTCLLALENCKDLTTLVTVGELPPQDFINGAEHIGLKKGETLSMEQLLYATMIFSGNDAADAVAQYIGGGSIDNFIAMMNQKAQDLGMTGTHYKDSNGLANDPEHVTTASDMAKLAAVAMQYPEFVKIVSTPKYTMGPTNKHPDGWPAWSNTNYLLRNEKNGKYPGSYFAYANGIKTGSTSMAGNALVSSAEENGVSLIGVVLHDNPRKNIFSDSILMFNYGFKYYDTVDLLNLVKNNESFSADIKNAAGNDPGAGKLSLLLRPQSTKAYITDKADVIAEIKNDPGSLIKSQVTYTKDTAPIKRDETIGTVTFSYNDNPVLVCDLLASRDVAEMPTPAPSPSAVSGKSGSTLSPGSSSGAAGPAAKSSGAFGSVLVWVGIIIIVLALAMLAIRIVNVQRRNRRHRQYNFRQGGGAKLRR